MDLVDSFWWIEINEAFILQYRRYRDANDVIDTDSLFVVP